MKIYHQSHTVFLEDPDIAYICQYLKDFDFLSNANECKLNPNIVSAHKESLYIAYTYLFDHHILIKHKFDAPLVNYIKNQSTVYLGLLDCRLIYNYTESCAYLLSHQHNRILNITDDTINYHIHRSIECYNTLKNAGIFLPIQKNQRPPNDV